MTARLDRNAGLSLLELLIAVIVGAVILAGVATAFYSFTRTNAATRDRDLASGRAQAISTSLSTSIRNASAIKVETAGNAIIARAVVATGTGGWECRAWAIVDLTTRTSSGSVIAASDGKMELRYLRYETLKNKELAPPPALSWTVLADQVDRVDASTPTPAAPGAATPSPPPYFDWSQTVAPLRLTWNFKITAAEQATVNSGSTTAVSGTALARSYQQGDASTCW
jgi:Tfp pilus assembly protein PilV